MTWFPAKKYKWIFASLLVLCGQHLFAQGCVSCYTAAAAAKESAVRGLRHGILILLFPPLVLFCGIVAAAVWRAKGERAKSEETDL